MFQAWFQRLSIQKKFSCLVMAVAALALGLGLCAFGVRESIIHRRTAQHEAQIIANLLASNSLAAVVFEDAEAARKSLELLGSQPRVAFAVLYLPDGRPLATFGKAPPEALNRPFREGTHRHFPLLVRDQRISSNNAEVGRLRLAITMEGLVGALGMALAAAAAIGMVAFGLSVLASMPLRQLFTRPLEDMARTARRVTQEGDYTARVPGEGLDELGQLLKDFNGMLAQIEASDRELRDHRNQLEREVALRTRDLSIAMEKAEAANKAKSEFLATMSHEIRTPLNGILGITTLLLKAALPPREMRLAQEIGLATEALLSVINNLLDYTRLEAGGILLEKQPFDPELSILNLVEVCASQPKAKSLELCVDIDLAVPQRLIGDPNRIAQVLLNLLGNAIKFTHEGSVTVRMGPAPERPGVWRIEVADTGIGIAPEALPHLFEAFTQADASFARRFGGSGLGLSISRKLTHLMGGTLEAIPGSESGTTFRLELPLEACEAPPYFPSMAGHRALLMGSLPATLRVLGRQLQALGIDVAHPDEGGGMPPGPFDMVAIAMDPSRGPDGLAPMPPRREGPSRTMLCIPFAHMPEGCMDLGDFDDILSMPASRDTLRRTVADLMEPQSPRAPRSDSSAESLQGLELAQSTQGRHILLVDDSAMNLEVFAEMLTIMGHEVSPAIDGYQALELLQQGPFDLVLMDCQMPNMDGFESTRRLRRLEVDGRRTPVIALTGNASSEDRARCLEAGMDDFLTKPVRSRELQAMIDKWSPQDSGNKELGRPTSPASSPGSDAPS